MRDRWQTVSNLWEANRAAANRIDLVQQLDYYGKLLSQLEWQHNKVHRPLRIVQTEAGQPTAALISADTAIVDSTLYWITCKDIKDINEAYYLPVFPIWLKQVMR